MDSKELAKLAIKALEDKKGDNIRIIDIAGISILGDYFIVAEGSNHSQIQAMVDNVEKELAKEKVYPKQIEGYETANWVLMDYLDIIVHVFDRESRSFYDLERIWRDGKIMDSKDFE